jgi:hypothetical protein
MDGPSLESNHNDYTLNNETNTSKTVLLNQYCNHFYPFYISRNILELNYPPVFLSIVKKQKTVFTLNKLFKKYYPNYDFTPSQQSLDLIDYPKQLPLLSKDKVYSICLDEIFKDQSNFYLDYKFVTNYEKIVFTINTFFHQIKNHVKALVIYMTNETYKNLFDMHLRTDANFIFIDDYYEEFFKYIKYVCNLNFSIKLDFTTHLLCIDRTQNWTEMKTLKYFNQNN